MSKKRKARLVFSTKTELMRDIQNRMHNSWAAIWSLSMADYILKNCDPPKLGEDWDEFMSNLNLSEILNKVIMNNTKQEE
jgi:hypothetical protein